MKKQLTGTVVSTKMQKTILVSVERKFRHPFYGKVIIRNKKYKVHADEKVNDMDLVLIEETRPISKDVHFKLLHVVKAYKPAGMKAAEEPAKTVEVVQKEVQKEVQKPKVKRVRKTAKAE